MDIDNMEAFVERMLLGIGIENHEISGLILIVICLMASYVAVWYFATSIKCRKISCGRLDRALSSNERAEQAFSSVKEDLQKLKENERTIMKDTDKFHDILREMSRNINQLHGIMLSNASQGIARKQIIHED